MDVPVLAYAAAAFRKRWAARACRSRPRISNRPPSGSARSIYDEPVRQPVIAGQRRRVQDFGTNRRRAQAPAYAGDRHIVKIAFIVQRYGAEILGGAEYHCRLVAERLALRHQVDVLTTCARDYLTWANDTPKAPDRLRGVTVRRFATLENARHRRLQPACPTAFSTNRTRPQEELEWLKQQGPWSPGLIDYLERHHQHYDVLVFFTYLYAPTVIGIKVAPSKIHPRADGARRTADPPGALRDVFAAAAGIAWNTRSRAPFRVLAVPSARARRGRRGMRRRPAGGRCVAAQPTNRRSTPAWAASRCRRTSRARPTPSAAAIACTIRFCCTAAASIRARAAKSCSSTSRPT